MIVNLADLLADLKARDAKKPRLQDVPTRGQQLSASCRPTSEPAWLCAPERDEWDYTKNRPQPTPVSPNVARTGMPQLSMRVLRPTICEATRLQIKRLEYEVGSVYKQISAYISWPFVAETKAVRPEERERNLERWANLFYKVRNLERVRKKARLVAKASVWGSRSRQEEWKACRSEKDFIGLILKYGSCVPDLWKRVTGLEKQLRELQLPPPPPTTMADVPFVRQKLSKNDEWDSDYEPSADEDDDEDEGIDEHTLPLSPLRTLRGGLNAGPSGIWMDKVDTSKIKRDARARADGSHWLLDKFDHSGSGEAWFAEHERNYRLLTALAPSELKARARTAGASQADIDAIVQNPRRPRCVCINDARHPQDCWLKHKLRELIQRKQREEKDRLGRVDRCIAWKAATGEKRGARPAKLTHEQFAAIKAPESSVQFKRKCPGANKAGLKF